VAVGPAGTTWIADPGIRSRLVEGTIDRRDTQGSVTAVTGDGTVARTLPIPRHDLYGEKPYRPTSVALERLGDAESPIWVADGYGASLVHRFTADGTPDLTLDGSPVIGRFDCPHAVEIDRRGPEPTLLVADRGNAVIHRFALDGRHLATLGPEGFTTPSAFAIAGDVLVVAELRGRLAVLDPEGRLMGHLGDGSAHVDEDGWPNQREGDRTRRRAPLEPGRFIAPHGITALDDGRVLVGEWVIGGRLVRLTPVA
jgi:hypothetical protein